MKTREFQSFLRVLKFWFFSAQTYEGGLGGEPGNEAHGGYTFCGVAALLLVDRADALDVPRLLHWVAHRQVATLTNLKLRNPFFSKTLKPFQQVSALANANLGIEILKPNPRLIG